MNNKKKPIRARGAWIDEIWAGVGRYVQVETSTGVLRSGRLTGLRTRVVRLNKLEEMLPMELEMNGDPTDLVPVSEIVKIDIDE